MTGAPKALLNLVGGLPDTYDVHVATFGHGDLVQRMHELGIKVTVLPSSIPRGGAGCDRFDSQTRMNFGLRVWECYRLIKKIDPDLVYINTITRVEVAIAAFLGNRKTVLHVHEGMNFFKPRSLRAKIKLFTLFLISKNVICVSESIKSLVNAQLFFQRNINVVYNGIDDDFSGHEPSEVAMLRRLRQEKFALVVGYCGSLVARKRPDVFLEAAKIVVRKRQNIIFLMVGGTKSEFNSLCCNDVMLLDMIGKELLHVEFTSRPDLFLKEMDIFCSTSDIEPFALINLENALLGNGASIVSNIDGNIEFVREGETGIFFNASDPMDLAEKIEQLIDNPTYRASLVTAARRLVATNYSVEAYVGKIDRVLQSV